MAATYDELVADRRPFRRRQLLAVGLLVGAAVGVLVTLLGFRESNHSLFWHLLLHAFEGAVVGGLCDWYAVVKTYRTVETNRDNVATAIGQWVARELLSHQVIHERIKALLNDPATQDQLVALLDSRLGTHEEVERWLQDKWDEVEPTVIAWGKTLRFDEDALAEIDATLLDQDLTAAVQTCLGSALLALSDAPQLERLIKIALEDTNWFIKLMGGLSPGKIRSDIARIGADLRDRAYQPRADDDKGSPARILAAALPPLRQALAGYIKGWNALGEEQREKAVVATLGHLRGPLIASIGRLVAKLHEDLRKAETLMELELIGSLVDELQQHLDQNVSDKIGEVVSGALKGLPAADFRRNLENNTRNYLELIRINGTLLGFVVGGGFGLLLGLLGAPT